MGIDDEARDQEDESANPNRTPEGHMTVTLVHLLDSIGLRFPVQPQEPHRAGRSRGREGPPTSTDHEAHSDAAMSN